jgi:uncharacterized protein (DUF2147 family)
MAGTAIAQSKSIIGIWLDQDKKGHTEIYKSPSGKYFGKIVWLKEPIDPETGKTQLDKNNDDPTKRNRPTLGILAFTNFVESKPGYFTGGEVYNPKDGKTYSCKLELLEDGRLKVRGFVGISLLGKTEYMTRVK